MDQIEAKMLEIYKLRDGDNVLVTNVTLSIVNGIWHASAIRKKDGLRLSLPGSTPMAALSLLLSDL